MPLCLVVWISRGASYALSRCVSMSEQVGLTECQILCKLCFFAFTECK